MIKSKNEHGIHSPFLFRLYNEALSSNDQYYCFSEIERNRTQLLNDETYFESLDFGAGSKGVSGKQARVAEVAKSSLAPVKTAQVYFKLVNCLRPTTILELGTSFGISTAYLAKGNASANVYSFEGNPFLTSYSKELFSRLQINNVIQIEGDINQTLDTFLSNNQKEIDFVIIDANHKSDYLFSYLEKIKPFLSSEALVIIDDISWSDDMRWAWEVIRKKEDYTLTFENINQGFLCTSKNLTKQHFYLRF